MLSTETTEFEASFHVSYKSASNLYDDVFGRNWTECDAVVDQTRVYFDTSTADYLCNNRVIALAQRPDLSINIICKAIIGLHDQFIKEKLETCRVITDELDLKSVLYELGEKMGRCQPVIPTMRLVAKRHYCVLRRSSPTVHICLDHVSAYFANAKCEEYFVEVETSFDGLWDPLFRHALDKIFQHRNILTPVDSKYSYFMESFRKGSWHGK